MSHDHHLEHEPAKPRSGHQGGRHRAHPLPRPRGCQGDSVFVPLPLEDTGRLVQAVPHLLGFRPQPGTLALVGLDRGCIEIIFTMPLPAPGTGARDPAASFDQAWIALDAHGCDNVSVIAYADGHRLAGLRDQLRRAAVPLSQIVRVHEQRWWTFECPQPEGCDHPACTREGDTVPQDRQIVAAMASLGYGSPGSPDDMRRLLQPGYGAVVRAVAAHLPLSPVPPAHDLYSALTQARSARQERPLPLDPAQAATLLQGLAHQAVLDACLPWHDDAAWWLWTELIRHAPPGWVAPVATTLAFTSYQRGNGILAGLAAERALADQPGFPGAQLLVALLDAVITPEQLRSRTAEQAAVARRARLALPVDATPVSGAVRADRDRSRHP